MMPVSGPGPTPKDTRAPRDSFVPELSGSSLSSRSHRRQFLTKLCAVAGLGGAGIVGWDQYEKHQYALLVQRFGTRQNPTYQIKESLHLPNVESMRDIIKSNNLRIDPEKITQFTGEVRGLISKVQGLPSKKQLASDEAGALDGFKAKLKLAFLEREQHLLHVKIAPHVTPSVAGWNRIIQEYKLFQDIRNYTDPAARTTLESKYGSPVSLARHIIYQLTERELPEDIDLRESVEHRPSEDIRTPTEVVDTWPYTAQVLHYVFRAGIHIASNHDTSASNSSPEWSSEGNQVWKEACGRALRAAAASHLSSALIGSPDHTREVKGLAYPELAGTAKIIERHFSLLPLIHHYGNHESRTPIRAAVIFDAALSTIGNIANAYNFLTSNTELTPQMKRCIERHQAVFDDYDISDTVVDAPFRQLDHYRKKMDALFESRRLEYSTNDSD